MTPDERRAERYGQPISDRPPPPLREWTAAEQHQHRVELVGAEHARWPQPPRRARLSRTGPDLAGERVVKNQGPPAARKAKGTTLEELLDEW